MTNKIRGVLLTVGVAIGWVMLELIIKKVNSGGYNGYLTTGIGYLIQSGLGLIILKPNGGSKRPSRGLMLVIVVFCVNFGIESQALRFTSLGLFAVLTNVSLIVTMLYEIYHKKVRGTIIATVLIIGGNVVCNINGLDSGTTKIGIILSVIIGLLFGVQNLLRSFIAKTDDIFYNNLYTYFIGGIVICGYGLLYRSNGTKVDLCIAFCFAVVNFITFIIQMKALELVSAHFFQIAVAVQIPMQMAVGALLLGESITVYKLIGAGIVLAGIVYYSGMKSKNRSETINSEGGSL